MSEKEILCVEICEAKPNTMFTEEQRQWVRFLRYSRRVECPICKRKVKIHWTMLCEFIACSMPEDSFSMTESDVLAPLTPVCDEHPLKPAAV